MDCSLPQVRSGLQAPLVALRDRVSTGESLATAMQQESWLFDDLMIGMVRVGEHAGNLEAVLDQVSTFRENSSQLRDRVLSAVMYPAIVLCVSIVVSLFLKWLECADVRACVVHERGHGVTEDVTGSGLFNVGALDVSSPVFGQ